MADASTDASASASTPGTAAAPVATCFSPGCGKPSSLQCPTCKQIGMPASWFCDQDCFKRSWKAHNELHKIFKERAAFQPPQFKYTGPLRPHYVTPQRSVPPHIRLPDYALTSIPQEELNSRAVTTIEVKTPEQLAVMRAACRVGREVLDIAGRAVRPGITTEEIDVIVHEATVARNAYPSPLNYRGFPKSCCTSVNEVICHGIPDARPLQDGDIVNIDISVFYEGMHADLNETFCVGTKVPAKHKLLIKATHDSMMRAIQKVAPGTMFRDFGPVIFKHVNTFGFDVVRTYTGHGIGALFHCAPNVPHYAKNKAIGQCKPGVVFTIEPMVNVGRYDDVLWPDDWTAVTEDGLGSAQFEHTMVVTDTGVEVLTARTANSVPHWWEVEPDSVAAVIAAAGLPVSKCTPALYAAACVDLSVDPATGGIVERALPMPSVTPATAAVAASGASAVSAADGDESGDDESGDEADEKSAQAGASATGDKKKKKKKNKNKKK